MPAHYWEAFYYNQGTVYLQERAKQITEFLNCLEVIYGEGVIEDEGRLLLSNQAKAKLELIEKILKDRQ